MQGWPVLIGLVLLSAAAVLLLDHCRRQHEMVYVQRMKRSMLYYEILSLVEEAKKHEIDRVQIERNRIIFFAVYPPGKIGEYVLTDHGHRPLNPQRTLALMQALSEDLPILQDNRCYRLQRYLVTRPNGQRDYGFRYTIRSHYKAKVMYAQQRRWSI